MAIYRQTGGSGSGDADTLDTIDSTGFARLNASSNFTVTPTVGGSPVLTSAPGTIVADGYQHVQSIASASWVVNHSFNTDKLLVQVFNQAGEEITPNTVVKTNANTTTITFGAAQAGTADVMPYA